MGLVSMTIQIGIVNHKFQFDLVRRTGENIYLYRGNEMVSANDRGLHHAPRGFLMSHLRDIGKESGMSYRKEQKVKEGQYIYTENKPCHVLATINPPTNAHMDAPNWYPTIKALMDGLTDAKIFSDDNDNIVQSLTFIPGEKTENGKYRIDISLIDGKPPLRLEQLTLKELT